MEYSLFVFGALWLLGAVVSLFQESIQRQGAVEQIAGYLVATCIPLAVLSGLVWMVAEVVAGFREPRHQG